MKRNETKTALTGDELSVLCWQLGQLCRAGMSWSDSAALLAEDAPTPRSRALLAGLRDALAAGVPLDRALAEAGEFPPYLLRMVSIGLAAGRAEQVLEALSGYYRRQSATGEALRRAVTYPAVMAALIALVFLVLVRRVLPVLTQVFAQVGGGASPMAAALLRFGGLGRWAAVALAVLLLAGAAVLLLFFRGERGAALFARGATGAALARGQFASAMALMLQSGLPLDEAIDRTAELLERTPLQAQVGTCRAQMLSGVPFPRAVEDAGLLTGLQAGLLSAGFRSGASDAAMTEVAARCQAEGEELLTRLLSRFEYALVIVLCAAVGLVLLSVMLPLLGVLSAVGG